MASVRRRGKTWTYSVEEGKDSITGNRQQKTKGGFKTKKEAQLAAYKHEELIAGGVIFQENNITFGHFAEVWFDFYKTQVKISSVDARRSPLNLFIAEWGHLPLKKITRHMYQDYLNKLNLDYGKNYLDSIHTTGNLVFKHAIRKDLITNTPTESFIKPKKLETIELIEENENTEAFFEVEELRAFLEIVKKKGIDWDYLTFVTLAYTGLRVGELLALKWTDVDLDKKTLRVSKTYYNRNNNSNYKILPPKTKSSARTISIDEKLAKLFKKHFFEQLELKMRQRHLYQDSGFIFAENSGQPRNRKKVDTRLDRILRIMSFNKNITPHSFRHTHASLLIEAGVGMKEIQERLGHSKISTTMDTYAHMTKILEEKASQKFSELLRDFL